MQTILLTKAKQQTTYMNGLFTNNYYDNFLSYTGVSSIYSYFSITGVMNIPMRSYRGISYCGDDWILGGFGISLLRFNSHVFNFYNMPRYSDIWIYF